MATPTATPSTGGEDPGTLIFIAIVYCAASAVCVILSFTQRRTRLGRQVCCGVPGIVPPVHFLSPSHRIVYTLAAGALAGTFTNLFLMSERSWIRMDDPYLTAFLNSLMLFVIIFLATVLTYPVFACVNAPIPIVGYCLGALYTDLFFSYNIFQVVIVLSNAKLVSAATVVINAIPVLLCLLAVMGWYHMMFVLEMVRICRRQSFQPDKWLLTSQQFSVHTNHVKHLLTPSSWKTAANSCGWRCRALRYPLQFMMVTTVVTIGLFQLTVTMAAGTFQLISNMSGNLTQNGNSNQQATDLARLIMGILNGFKVVSVVGPVVSCLLCYSLYLHLLFSMKMKLVSIQKLEKKPSSVIKWPTWTLFSLIKCAGYQIAIVIAAWLIYTLIIYVIGAAVVIFVHLNIGFYVFQLALIVFWVAAIAGVELVLCKLVFLRNHNSGTIVINNRRLFDTFQYVMFLYHIATGLLVTVYRTTASILMTLFSLVRMDRNIFFIRGFEKLEIVNVSFTNFLLMEHLLHNPALLVFVDLMRSITATPGDDEESVVTSSKPCEYGTLASARNGKDTDHRPRVSRKALNRWMVAYTLLRNPSLQQLTASRLAESVTAVDSESFNWKDAYVSDTKIMAEF